MGVETTNGIWDLNRLWPLSSEYGSESDDHIRIIKSTLYYTFKNISAGLSVTSDNINCLDGIESNVKDQLDAFSASLVNTNANVDSMNINLPAALTQLATNTNNINTLGSIMPYAKRKLNFRMDASATLIYAPSGATGQILSQGNIRITYGESFSSFSDIFVMATPVGEGMWVSINPSNTSCVITCRGAENSFTFCGAYVEVAVL